MPALNQDCLESEGRLLLGYSGGPDSLCLLALLSRSRWRESVLAVHVDHGLDPDSRRRSTEAAGLAAMLGMPCRIERVDVERNRRLGPEAAARQARYRCLEGLMGPGDTLLTAHHADDQVETVLLRLLRGAGPRGLSGMRPRRRFGPGWLARPLLHWSRNDVLEELERLGLEPVIDPGNEDLSPDRNYLRHVVLPTLDQRWTAARSSILQAARWQADAAEALRQRADRDLARLLDADSEALKLDALCRLPDERALAALRRWCVRAGAEAPPSRMLEELLRQCRKARRDRLPRLDAGEAVLRAWGGRLWLDRSDPKPPDRSLAWDSSAELSDFLPGAGRLRWFGIERLRLGRHWSIGGPLPGERLQLHPGGPRRRVADLLREAGIPPWRRSLCPRLRIDGQLVAVGDELLDADFARALRSSGSRLEWQRPGFGPEQSPS